MLNVFVAYDLMHPGQNYGAVEAAVSGLGSAVKLLNTTWYVRTGLSLDQVRAHVSAAMDLNDRLLVIDAANASGWNVNQATWQTVHALWNQP
ncbi:MAG: hypothetical protein R3E11_11590 [Sphingobium sp.]|uniref:Uncharacterized protein n=1 Tax=Brucella grignonensis TaxID=94627 RepID=A0A256FCC9_9HYPH|nr:hypothetical protein [Brucella grignonensis]NKB84167.1 hypothetical protein [Brucella grignonensis]OYR12529.1 hypothetical protein CEV33_1313 [Brucella grignonensis]